MTRKRILTGIRPTGALHLGHYAGALENWVRLQKQYECFFLIADYQVSDYADDIDRVRESVWDVALDWLSVGLDPDRSHFVIESMVPQHTELSCRRCALRDVADRAAARLGILVRTPAGASAACRP